MEESQAYPSGYEFQYTRCDRREKEDPKGLFPELESEAQDYEAAKAVDRDPRSECRAALDPLAKIEAVEDLLIDEAEDAAESKHKHQKRESGLEVIFVHFEDLLWGFLVVFRWLILS